MDNNEHAILLKAGEGIKTVVIQRFDALDGLLGPAALIVAAGVFLAFSGI